MCPNSKQKLTRHQQCIRFTEDDHLIEKVCFLYRRKRPLNSLLQTLYASVNRGLIQPITDKLITPARGNQRKWNIFLLILLSLIVITSILSMQRNNCQSTIMADGEFSSLDPFAVVKSKDDDIFLVQDSYIPSYGNRLHSSHRDLAWSMLGSPWLPKNSRINNINGYQIQ